MAFSSVPAEDTLLPGIDVGDDRGKQEEEDSPEEQHGLTAHWLKLGEIHSPRIEKDDFDIENQEGHGHDVEADIESLPCGPYWIHPRLVRLVLGFAVCLRAEDSGSDDVYNRKDHRHQDEYGDGQVVDQAGSKKGVCHQGAS